MTEQRTFKWGDQEYLVDDLLKLHAEQENNYYNFARDKGKYNNEALTGLKSAVTNRINSVKNGAMQRQGEIFAAFLFLTKRKHFSKILQTLAYYNLLVK